ncbi:MAG: hypothetical protein EOP04_22105, partial [Proteobacteria bacterium]
MRLLLPVLFGIFLISGTVLAVEPRIQSQMQTLCSKQNAPILSYQELYTDKKTPDSAGNEIWLDRVKEEIKGLWLDDKKALYISGRMTSKDSFYLCLYDQKLDNLPKNLVFGRYTPHSIQLIDPNQKIQEIERADSLLLYRDYSVRYKLDKDAYHLNGKTTDEEPDTCVYTDSTFTLMGGPKKVQSVNDRVNRLLDALYKRLAELPKRTARCEAESQVPLTRSLSLSLMHAGGRYVSVKVDDVRTSSKDSQWNGESFNYDRALNRTLDFDDIIRDRNSPELIKEVKRRLQLVQGEVGRFKDLGGAS